MTETMQRLELREIDWDRDAEAFADMWRASDDQWPGTWSGGVPVTASFVRERFTRMPNLRHLVWEDVGTIAASCVLQDVPTEEGVCYVPNINVAPAYQKRGLARRMLCRCVELAVELGYRRLDLNTWPGNIKAVPTYKRCGFCWRPDTSVHMVNHVPAILAMPVARPFFDLHDWYASLRRELDQSEDDERWEGLKVFTYRFEADGDTLAVRADAQSQTITAVETATLEIAAIPGRLEPARGLDAPIAWRVRNTSDRARSVSLVVHGDEHLQIEQRETFTLEPGTERVVEATVRIAADIPRDRLREHVPAPAVRTLAVVDGEVIELASGFRPRLAVGWTTDPRRVTAAVGVVRPVLLQLRNRTDLPASAEITIAAPDGVRVEPASATVELPPNGRAGVPLSVTTGAGAHAALVSVRTSIDGREVVTEPRPLEIHAPGIGGLVAGRIEEGVRVENDHVRVIVAERGAKVGLSDPRTGRQIAVESGLPAPPIHPNAMGDAVFDLAIDRSSGRLSVVASAMSPDVPGLVMRKRVTVTASPVVEVSYELCNTGTAPAHAQISHDVWISASMRTLPLDTGVVSGPRDELPGGGDEDVKRPDAYGEQWCATTSHERTSGVVWGDDSQEIDNDGGWFDRLTVLREIAPGGTVRFDPVFLYAGDGDARAVRDLWRRTRGVPRPHGERDAEPAPVLDVRLADGALTVAWHGTREIEGVLCVDAPAGWRIEPSSQPFARVRRGRPARLPVTITPPAVPSAGLARVTVRTESVELPSEVPLLHAGAPDGVEVREDGDVYTIANGLLEATVAPSFAATVASMRLGGIERLSSAHPQARPFSLFSPWHGGLYPILMLNQSFPGRLHRADWSAQALPDGVRMSAVLDEVETRGLAVEIDVRTSRDAPFLHAILRVRNLTSVAFEPEIGFIAFAAGEGTVLQTPRYAIGSSGRFVQREGSGWNAAVRPDGEALALVPSDPGAPFDLHLGSDGAHPAAFREPRIGPEETIELGAWLVAGRYDELRVWAEVLSTVALPLP